MNLDLDEIMCVICLKKGCEKFHDANDLAFKQTLSQDLFPLWVPVNYKPPDMGKYVAYNQYYETLVTNAYEKGFFGEPHSMAEFNELLDD